MRSPTINSFSSPPKTQTPIPPHFTSFSQEDYEFRNSLFLQTQTHSRLRNVTQVSDISHLTTLPSGHSKYATQLPKLNDDPPCKAFPQRASSSSQAESKIE